jgi:hypothetical protein
VGWDGPNPVRGVRRINPQPMNPRGNPIKRIAALVLAATLLSGALALPASSAAPGALASSAKKCSKKKHHRKRRCKKRLAAPPASISISPTSQDFGMPSVGSEPTFAFTVTNVGGSVSGVPVTAITGPSAGSFDIVANTCTTRMSPTAACRIDVKLPFRDPVGPKAATLTVTASPGGNASAALTGDVEI